MLDFSILGEASFHFILDLLDDWFECWLLNTALIQITNHKSPNQLAFKHARKI